LQDTTRCSSCEFNRKQIVFRETETEQATQFKSGAKRSSKMKRYDLIPKSTLDCLADRLELGAAKYGEWNWQKAILAGDKEFLRDALNHMQSHLSNVTNGDFSEDSEYGNLGGILFGCMVRLAAIEHAAKKAKEGTENATSGS
jgi:hypothetical protein